jgi:hypothetical protein
VASALEEEEVNPLHLPSWKKKEPELPARNNRASHLGLKAEVMIVDKDAEHHVVIEVRGVKGAHPGKYKVAYVEGRMLGDYLRRLRLKRVACYSAVYDITNKKTGRLRMTYVPSETSHIVLGNRSTGVSTKYQRSSIDAQRVATRMGGGRKVVEVEK